MKNLLIIIGTLVLVSCDTPMRSREIVTKTYSNAEVQVVPNLTRQFIIRQPDGSVLHVYCGNVADDGISTVIKLFPANIK